MADVEEQLQLALKKLVTQGKVSHFRLICTIAAHSVTHEILYIYKYKHINVWFYLFHCYIFVVIISRT